MKKYDIAAYIWPAYTGRKVRGAATKWLLRSFDEYGLYYVKDD